MNTGQQFAGILGAPANGCDLVVVATALQSRVSRPTIGMDGAAWLDAILHKPQQAVCGGFFNPPHANPSVARPTRFSRDLNQTLVNTAPARLAFFQTAEIGLVHLHPSRQLVA